MDFVLPSRFPNLFFCTELPKRIIPSIARYSKFVEKIINFAITRQEKYESHITLHFKFCDLAKNILFYKYPKI